MPRSLSSLNPFPPKGRGTQNPITGPPRDRNSGRSTSIGGAYIFIDSDFPRRPEDVARLESIEFQETGELVRTGELVSIGEMASTGEMVSTDEMLEMW